MTTTTSDGSTASYYELPQGATQLQDLISHRNMNSQDGEIFRAIYRKGLASHSDALRDARKVLFYAQAEVKRLEDGTSSADLNPKFGSPPSLAIVARALAIRLSWFVDFQYDGRELMFAINLTTLGPAEDFAKIIRDSWLSRFFELDRCEAISSTEYRAIGRWNT